MQLTVSMISDTLMEPYNRGEGGVKAVYSCPHCVRVSIRTVRSSESSRGHPDGAVQ